MSKHDDQRKQRPAQSGMSEPTMKWIVGIFFGVAFLAVLWSASQASSTTAFLMHAVLALITLVLLMMNFTSKK